jgi:hypothetical protein
MNASLVVSIWTDIKKKTFIQKAAAKIIKLRYELPFTERITVGGPRKRRTEAGTGLLDL